MKTFIKIKQAIPLSASTALVIALAVGAWFAWLYYSHHYGAVSNNAQPVTVGILARIDATHSRITVKAIDGSEYAFSIPATVPLTTLVEPGETGKVWETLSAGDTVEVTLDKDESTVHKLVVLPAVVPVISTTTLVTTLVSATNSSVTVVSPNPDNMPAMSSTWTFIITKNTHVLSEVQRDQIGKTLVSSPPGTIVKIYPTKLEPGANVLTIVLLDR